MMKNLNIDFEKWINVREMNNLEFQHDTVTKVQDSLVKYKRTVLAAAPSAGKTLMSIYLIEDYLKKNPTHKVLVLAHGTTVLRTQYYQVVKELNPNFTYNIVETFSDYDERAQVNICLPQTLAGHDLPKIDLLGVDEAHQFYLGKKMVKNIIEETKPKRELLLTGTPSPFILRKESFNIIPVSMNTIFDAGMVADLRVDVATSAYNFDNKDFTQNDELKPECGNKIAIKDTEKTLNDLLGKVVYRLTSIDTKNFINFTQWLPVLKKLKKTMFVCTSRQQALQVQRYFEKNNVNSVVSISGDNEYADPDSEEIKKFVDDNDILMLIVVGRGILGFNFEKLVNVIDMSLSKNIDRIYQLLCRVVRPHPDGDNKLFFKVAPNIRSDYYKYIMTAVLSLTEEEFFMKYNGKNFDDMRIVVRKKQQKKVGKSKSKKSSPKFVSVEFEGLPAFQFFKDLYHKKDSLLHTYAYTRMKTVRAQFMDNTPKDYWTEERIYDIALDYIDYSKFRTEKWGAYQKAIKLDILAEVTAHMDKQILWVNDKKLCCEDALNYTTRVAWQRGNGSAYHAARKMEWLDECCAHMKLQKHPNGFWNEKKKCLESALKCVNVNDWKDKFSGALASALRHGWYKECTAHMNLCGVHRTDEEVLQNAFKYKDFRIWLKESNNFYQLACRRNLIKECTVHMINVPTEKVKSNGQRRKWTDDELLEDALEYGKLNDWYKNSSGAQIARKRGKEFFNKCTAHMKNGKREPWTDKELLENAQQYKTKTEWNENDSGAVTAARKRGKEFFNKCTAHMTDGYIKLTEKEILKSALKCKIKQEWRDGDNKAYNAAKRNGKEFFNKCTAHMVSGYKGRFK